MDGETLEVINKKLAGLGRNTIEKIGAFQPLNANGDPVGDPHFTITFKQNGAKSTDGKSVAITLDKAQILRTMQSAYNQLGSGSAEEWGKAVFKDYAKEREEENLRKAKNAAAIAAANDLKKKAETGAADREYEAQTNRIKAMGGLGSVGGAGRGTGGAGANSKETMAVLDYINKEIDRLGSQRNPTTGELEPLSPEQKKANAPLLAALNQWKKSEQQKIGAPAVVSDVVVGSQTSTGKTVPSQIDKAKAVARRAASKQATTAQSVSSPNPAPEKKTVNPDAAQKKSESVKPAVKNPRLMTIDEKIAALKQKDGESDAEFDERKQQTRTRDFEDKFKKSGGIVERNEDGSVKSYVVTDWEFLPQEDRDKWPERSGELLDWHKFAQAKATKLRKDFDEKRKKERDRVISEALKKFPHGTESRANYVSKKMKTWDEKNDPRIARETRNAVSTSLADII